MPTKFSIKPDFTVPVLIVLLGILLGIAIPFLAGLPVKWIALVIIGTAAGGLTVASGRIRTALLLFLPVSILLNINYHFTYVAHVGVSDGLTIMPVDLFILGIVGIVLANSVFDTRKKLLLIPATIVPALLVLVADLLSMRSSPDAMLTFYGLLDHARGFVLYILVASQLKTQKDLKIVLIGTQAAALILGGICIVEAALGKNFLVNKEDIDPYERYEVFRAAGLSAPPGTGGMLASLVPLIAAQFFIFKNRFIKIVVLAVVCITFMGLLFTLTRGAMLSLGIALGPVLFLLVRKRLIGIKHISVGFILICMLLLSVQDKLFVRISEGAGNVTARLNLVGTAMEMVKDKPVSGVGLNTYTIEMERYESKSQIHDFRFMVHNKYLLTWAETGTVGLVAWVWLLIASMIICYQSTKHTDDIIVTMTAIGVFGALLTSMIHMNLESYEGGNELLYIMFLIGLSTALRSLTRQAR